MNSADIIYRGIDRLAGLSLGYLLVLIIVLRLAVGFVFPADETNTYEFGRIAQNLVEGHGFSYFPATETEVLPFEREAEATRRLPSAFMPPLYPLVVAGATFLSGSSHNTTVWTVRGFNLLFACGTALLLFLLARRLLDSRQGATLAVLGFAVYPTTMYMATQVSASNLYIPVQLAVLVLLLAAARRANGLLWAVAGLTVGALCLLRAETVVLIPVLALWLRWASKPVAGSRRYVLLGFFLLTAILPPGVWIMRNSTVFGQSTYTVATTGGYNLWRGNHVGASGSQEGSFDVPPELATRLEALPPTVDYELRVDGLFRKASIESMRSDPLGTVIRDVKKLALLLSVDVYDHRSLNPIYLLSWFLLLVVGTLGLVAWWRRRKHDRPTCWLVAGFLTVSIMVPTVFFVLARFKLPIEILLLIFAGGWLASLGLREADPDDNVRTSSSDE